MSRHTISFVILAGSAGCLVAPAGQQIPPTGPAHAAPAVVTEESVTGETVDGIATNLGRLDAEIVATARDAHGVEKAKIRTNPDGTVTKLAVYHTDASQIPEPVKKLVATKYPGATVAFYESEIHADGQRVYEVEVRPKNGPSCEVAATANGSELYTECEVQPSDLPVAVAHSLASLRPKARIREAERKTEMDGTQSYSLVVTDNDGQHYIYFAPDGTIQKHLLRVPAVLEVLVD